VAALGVLVVTISLIHLGLKLLILGAAAGVAVVMSLGIQIAGVSPIGIVAMMMSLILMILIPQAGVTAGVVVTSLSLIQMLLKLLICADQALSDNSRE
jgi:hypothetical protein